MNETETMPPSAAEPLPRPPARRQLGLLRRMLADPAPVLDELAGRYGPNCQLGMAPSRMAIIGDPASLRDLFALPSDHFRWGHRLNLLGFVVGPESMIVSDGADHKRRRSSVQGAFARRRLNGWIPMIVERTDAAIDDVLRTLDGDEQEIDLYEVGRSLVLDIVVRALFGERLAARADELGLLFQRPQAYIEAPAARQLPHPLPWTRRSRVRADRRALDAIIDEEMARLRAAGSGGSDDSAVARGGRFNVLAALVEDDDLSDGEIRDQVVTLMGAGYHTTAASLAWMFWCATLRPGLWKRLRLEADSVFGLLDGALSTPDHETLARLDLAQRTMKETTRLHPAGVVSPREATRDLVVGGYRIPKGTLILWSAHLAGRNAEAWPDPEVFDPDRFADLDDDQRALADLAWVPFGRGARNCVGFALAQIELTLIIARMAQRLEVTAGPAKPKPVGMVVNRPAGGARMRVAARSFRGPAGLASGRGEAQRAS